jgi:amidohydrolase family protein
LNPAKNLLLCLLLFESCGVAILDRLQVLTLKHKLSRHFEDFVRDLYHSHLSVLRPFFKVRAIAIKLVSRCPDVTFILDHCGVPQVKEKNLDPWRAYIKEIAQFPNVSRKISGLVAYADPKRWTIDDLRPFVAHTIASFGWIECSSVVTGRSAPFQPPINSGWRRCRQLRKRSERLIRENCFVTMLERAAHWSPERMARDLFRIRLEILAIGPAASHNAFEWIIGLIGKRK